MKYINELNNEYDQVKVIALASEKPLRWTCQCSCGYVFQAKGCALRARYHKTCGKCTINLKKTYSEIYNAWRSVKRRCYDKNHKNYPQYGAKGIKMWSGWLNDSKEFVKWSLLNGWQKGLQLDRYPDQRGSYSPNNCRWVTCKQNQNNRTNNIMVTAFGETLSLPIAKEKYALREISEVCLRHRITDLGWDHERALTTPPQIRNK